MKKLLLFWLFSASLSAFSQDTLKRGTPDTLRAIVLVTLHENGPAYSRMGFVVIEQGKRPVYLDCHKKALKLPQVGWGYQIVNPNEQVR